MINEKQNFFTGLFKKNIKSVQKKMQIV